MNERAARGQLHAGFSPEQIADALRPLVEFRTEGMSLDGVASLVSERLEPHLMAYDAPAFQSMFNGVVEPGAALGAEAALRWNQGVTNWQVSPGGAVLEELAAKALVRLFGLRAEAGATFMLAGSYANQQGLYMALHRYAQRRGFDFAERGLVGFEDARRLAVVVTRETHFSIRHAVRTLGLGEQSLVYAEVDERRKIDARRLRDEMRTVAAERDLFAIVTTAGTTSTGAIDPLDAVANWANEQRIWMHVDAAYGLAYKLVPEYAPLFAGIERADSIAWDPHKQMGVPIPSSVLFAGNEADFQRMGVFSAYFNRAEGRYPNPGLKSVPSTRPLAARPRVTSIFDQGLAGLTERLRAPLHAIHDFAAFLAREPDIEVAHAPDLGVLAFRFVVANATDDAMNRLNRDIFEAVQRTGERSISITELDGRAMLRVVAVSTAVTPAALADTLQALRAAARSLDVES
jgi:L-2,4-diaminobutyrate decarboxylase